MLKRMMTPVLVALTVVLPAAGCGDDGGAAPAGETTAEGTFVGTVDGTDAYIALVSDGERLAGYVCDGKAGAGSVSVSTWFTSNSGSERLLARDGTQLGDAVLASDGASGEISIGESSYEFEAVPASGDAGLYRGVRGELGEPRSVEVGQIVLADGSFRGAAVIRTRTPAPRTAAIAEQAVDGSAVPTRFGSVSLDPAPLNLVDEIILPDTVK